MTLTYIITVAMKVESESAKSAEAVLMELLKSSPVIGQIQVFNCYQEPAVRERTGH